MSSAHQMMRKALCLHRTVSPGVQSYIIRMCDYVINIASLFSIHIVKKYTVYMPASCLPLSVGRNAYISIYIKYINIKSTYVHAYYSNRNTCIHHDHLLAGLSLGSNMYISNVYIHYVKNAFVHMLPVYSATTLPYCRS